MQGKIIILGKPNVGKSSLFNRLIKDKVAITSEIEGTTRDINIRPLSLGEAENPFNIELCDTAGLMKKADGIFKNVKKMIFDFISENDLILYVISAESSVDDEDLRTFRALKNAILVVNKIDIEKVERWEYNAFGAEKIFYVSSLHNRGIKQLKDFLALRVGNSPLDLHSADLANSQNLGGNNAKIVESSENSPSLAEGARGWVKTPSLRADSQNLGKKELCEAPENSPASWCKKSESKDAEVPPADFLLEAEKRGSPPKSEKRQLLGTHFKKVGGSGAGGAALLRGKTSENNGNEIAESNRDSSPTAQNDNLMKIAESSLDSANQEKIAESTQESQGGLPREHSLARNDDSFLDSAFYEFSAHNFKGGHSGIDIDKNIKNAIVELLFALDSVREMGEFEILEISGGEARNSIPINARAVIATKAPINLTHSADSAPHIAIKKLTHYTPKQKALKSAVVADLLRLHNGIYEVQEGSVTSSLNFSQISPKTLKIMVRGNKAEFLERQILRLKYLFGEAVEISGFYNAWEANLSCGDFSRFCSPRFLDEPSVLSVSLASQKRKNSSTILEFASCKSAESALDSANSQNLGENQENIAESTLFQAISRIYQKHKIPFNAVQIHAGLECGILKEKCGLDEVVSIGPTILYPHSKNECLNLPSVGQIYEILADLVE